MNKTGSNSYIVHYCIAVASNYGYILESINLSALFHALSYVSW